MCTGSFWPTMGDIESRHMANISVGIRIICMRNKLNHANKDSNSASPPKNVKGKGKGNLSATETHQSRQSLQDGLHQHKTYMTQPRPGEIDPMNPKFENESFEICIYRPGLCIVMTAYTVVEGMRVVVGEASMLVDDVLSECQRAGKSTPVLRTFGLVNPKDQKPVYFAKLRDARKMVQSSIQVKMHFFTRAVTDSPQKMSQSVANQACYVDSPLCAGGIVTGHFRHMLMNFTLALALLLCLSGLPLWFLCW